MSPIFVVMLIAVCEPDLLHCAPIETWNDVWKSVEDCNRAKAWITREVEADLGGAKVVMGKCRLYLDEHRRLGDSMIAEHPEPSGHLLF